MTDLENMRAIFAVANITCREYTTSSRMLRQTVTVIETRIRKFNPICDEEMSGVTQVKVLHFFDVSGKLLRVMSKVNPRKAHNPNLKAQEDWT